MAFPNLREALENNIPVVTQARSCTILPNFVGCVLFTYTNRELTDRIATAISLRFHIHNGKDYVPVMVTQDMVGHKLGEFAQTRKRFSYKYVVAIPLKRVALTNPHRKSK